MRGPGLSASWWLSSALITAVTFVLIVSDGGSAWWLFLGVPLVVLAASKARGAARKRNF